MPSLGSSLSASKENLPDLFRKLNSFFFLYYTLHNFTHLSHPQKNSNNEVLGRFIMVLVIVNLNRFLL